MSELFFQNGYRLGSTGGSSQADSPHAQDSDPFMSTASLDTLKQVLSYSILCELHFGHCHGLVYYLN